jgi:ABC-2 type transport system permease protein
MTRIFIIAQAEFLALVRSKFFILSIVFLPVVVGATMSFLGYVERQVDRDERRFAVVDSTGLFYETIVSAAARQGTGSDEDEDRSDGDRNGDGEERRVARFVPERVDPSGRSHEDLTVALSDRVRRGEIFAFLLIPDNVLDPDSGAALEYYSQNTAYGRLSSWLTRTLNDAIQQLRLQRAGLDAAQVERLIERTPVSSFDLVERQVDGSIVPARKTDGIQQFGVPVFLMVVMFMSVMSNAQHLINATIEEKVSKISEVLLGSVSAFDLLAGKLLGIVAVSLLLALVYLAGGVYMLFSVGRPDLISLPLIGWFLLFLLCASLLFGALFQALSAACSDLKDAQTLLQPAMMVLMCAYLASFVVLRAPDSTLAMWLSFIPLITPFAMLLRLAVPPGPELWELVLAVVMLGGVTVATVWIAGRIFRVGLLMHGKPPNLPELLRWIGK